MNPRRLEHDWFSAPLPPPVELGDGTWLYSSFAFRHYRSQAPLGLRVGHDTGLYHGTFFDLGPQAQIRIGNYCSLVGAIVATDGRVEIGDYALIAHEVVLAQHGYWVPAPSAANVPSHTTDPDRHHLVIGNNVWIGARAVLLGNIHVGDNSVIGAAAFVTSDVPPNTVCAGNPARVIGQVPQPPPGGHVS